MAFTLVANIRQTGLRTKQQVGVHMQNPIPPRALSEAAAAEYIGMSKHFLRLGRQSGRLGNRTPPPAHVKAGRRVLYLIEDLNA